MGDVLTFPGFKTDHRLYDDEAMEVLDQLPKELRDKVRHAMESAISEYLEKLRMPTDVLLPENSTKEQKESIKSAIKKHQDICRSLMQDLAMSKAEQVLREHKSS